MEWKKTKKILRNKLKKIAAQRDGSEEDSGDSIIQL